MAFAFVKSLIIYTSGVNIYWRSDLKYESFFLRYLLPILYQWTHVALMIGAEAIS